MLQHPLLPLSCCIIIYYTILCQKHFNAKLYYFISNVLYYSISNLLYYCTFPVYNFISNLFVLSIIVLFIYTIYN